MNTMIYFVIGTLFSMTTVKILFRNPKIVKVYPTLENYNDIEYIDESGKIYKYDLIKL